MTNKFVFDHRSLSLRHISLWRHVLMPVRLSSCRMPHGWTTIVAFLLLAVPLLVHAQDGSQCVPPDGYDFELVSLHSHSAFSSRNASWRFLAFFPHLETAISVENSFVLTSSI